MAELQETVTGGNGRGQLLYDQEQNGAGHLTSVIDQAGTANYTYESWDA